MARKHRLFVIGGLLVNQDDTHDVKINAKGGSCLTSGPVNKSMIHHDWVGINVKRADKRE